MARNHPLNQNLFSKLFPETPHLALGSTKITTPLAFYNPTHTMVMGVIPMLNTPTVAQVQTASKNLP
jgi:hypothetical protein